MNLPTRAGSGFLALPTSAIGRVGAAAFVLTIASVALMATLTESLAAGWRGAVAMLVMASVMATVVCSLTAILARRERSWAVVVPALLVSVLVANEIVQQIRALLQ